MNLQRTIRKPVTIKGIGLHSGQEVQVRICPASPSSGIQFLRTDVKGSAPIAAHFKNVVGTQLATTLGRDNVTVSTIEHLMAAFMGLSVDNALVEVGGAEIPILDGSSLPFVQAIESVGLESQLQARRTVVLKKRIELRVGEKWAVAEPASQFVVHGSVEWDHPAIGYQEYRFVEGKTAFAQLANARTFCQLKDVEAMKKMGLAKGGSLDNAIVVDEARVLNPGGLRHVNEFARHKVLDALGDFKMSGFALRASIRLHRAGHDLHSMLLAEIFKDPSNYSIVGGSATDAAEEMSEMLSPEYAVSY